MHQQTGKNKSDTWLKQGGYGLRSGEVEEGVIWNFPGNADFTALESSPTNAELAELRESGPPSELENNPSCSDSGVSCILYLVSCLLVGSLHWRRYILRSLSFRSPKLLPTARSYPIISLNMAPSSIMACVSAGVA